IYVDSEHMEGITTIPNDPKYGPWAGTLLTGRELHSPSPDIVAIRPTGAVTFFVVHDEGGNPLRMEDCEVLPAISDLYITIFPARVLALKAADLASNGGPLGSAVGDVIIVAE